LEKKKDIFEGKKPPLNCHSQTIFDAFKERGDLNLSSLSKETHPIKIFFTVDKNYMGKMSSSSVKMTS